MRIRAILVLCVLVGLAAVVPASAAGPTAKAIIAGSSALWQSMALGAYNWKSTQTFAGGSCLSGFTAPCFHYTSSNGFQVNDRRANTKFGAGAPIDVDVNSIWIVWDSSTAATGPNYMAFIKVDSVVGDRCYYGQKRCDVTTAGGGAFPAAANAITVWPDGSTDSTVPATIQALFTVSGATLGPLVSAAATDVRAEDGQFAMCRALSNMSASPGGNAAMQGLGYVTGASNNPGVCWPASGGTQVQLDGTDVSDTSGSTAHVVAFSVTPGSKDPISGTTIVTGTTVPAGAAPVVFIAHTGFGSDPLANVTGVTDAQLQSLFANAAPGCDGSQFTGGTAGAIDVWIREPLSGTYNTTEYNVFVYPDFSGTSQEAYLNPTVSGNNPLDSTCPGGGGDRIRGIGTSHVVNGTLNDTTRDSIAYAFFSYGNVSAVSDAACSAKGGGNCRYFTLNGVDPIFHKYVATAGGTALDPGQPNAQVGQIPSKGDTSCGAFPCREDQNWAGGLSFPNLRNGQYRAWSILRLISDGSALSNIKNLVAASQTYAAINTPDFVPVVSVAANTTTGFPGDPGLQLLRSHYQQVDNAGTTIGNAPVDDSSVGDVGGDVAGCIEHFLPGTTSDEIHESDSVTGLIHSAPGVECSFAPTSH